MPRYRPRGRGRAQRGRGGRQANAQRFAQGLQRAGYATDPAYADKLSRVINTTLRLQRSTNGLEDAATMSASPLMSLGMKAMAASYAALQVTGHNIANASTQGYSRQTVQLTTPEGQFTGAGFFGRGVDVTTVGVGHAAGQFLNSMVDLASRPADNATRQVVLARAQEAAGRFAAAGEQLNVVQSNVTASLKAGIEVVNGLAKASRPSTTGSPSSRAWASRRTTCWTNAIAWSRA
jgi:hypothetical protein